MKEKFTWADLKKFCDELPEEELQKEVIWAGEESGGVVRFVYRLEEDYGVNEYCMAPVSVLEEERENEDEKIEVVYKEGTPMLVTK